jgi:hypothetical protein
LLSLDIYHRFSSQVGPSTWVAHLDDPFFHEEIRRI